jgi:hypothetical protein
MGRKKAGSGGQGSGIGDRGKGTEEQKKAYFSGNYEL